MTTATDRDAAARAELLAKLAVSRADLRRVLDPPRQESAADARSGSGRGGFPRSRTMQALTSGRGLGSLGAAAAGLMVARPALALRLLRMLPASAIARMLLTRVLSARSAKPVNPR